MCIELDFTHEDNIATFVSDNIEAINNGIDDVKKALNSHGGSKNDITEIKKYLRNKFFSEVDDQKASLLSEFEAADCTNDAIKSVANNHVYYKEDLKDFFEKELFKELFDNTEHDLATQIVDAIKNESTIADSKKKFVSSALTKIIKKNLVLIRQNGFSNNLVNVEAGVQTANAGDSAQFLFVSRAILAGFNCSNVDVRSSRYDAVIDYKGAVLRVQVKGISGNVVSFKDRDRGGRGIDTHNERNIGRRIKSDDCDIYVAVDKQVGICYLIPMESFVDPMNEDEIKSVNVSKLTQFRENWDIIGEVYKTSTRFNLFGDNATQSIVDGVNQNKGN